MCPGLILKCLCMLSHVPRVSVPVALTTQFNLQALAGSMTNPLSPPGDRPWRGAQPGLAWPEGSARVDEWVDGLMMSG